MAIVDENSHIITYNKLASCRRSFHKLLTHSVSCFVTGTPISSNVLGPEPGGLVGGFVCVGPGRGVGGCDGAERGPGVPGVVNAGDRMSGVLFLEPRSILEL